jgi:hypothetical protein
MIIHDKSKSCWICYQVIDHALIDFMEKSQKSLDFGIVPSIPTRNLSKYPKDTLAFKGTFPCPIILQGKVIGLFQVAYKKTYYTEVDLNSLQIIDGHVAPIIPIKLERAEDNPNKYCTHIASHIRSH